MNKTETRQIAFTEFIVDKIMNELDRRGLTQKDFAKIMKKSEAEVSRWLSGRSNLTIATVAKIADALDVDLLPVKMKSQPYQVPAESTDMVADSAASYGMDINAMKLQLMGNLMAITDIKDIRSISSFMDSLHRTRNQQGRSASWNDYVLSEEIQSLAAERRVDITDYKDVIGTEFEKKHQ